MAGRRRGLELRTDMLGLSPAAPAVPPLFCPALPCPVVACRSGGHSYQGYSVIAGAVTIDLILMNSTTVAADQQTALVQAGSRLGQLYFNVYNQTNGAKGAVGGSCPTVGTGGHFLGGAGRGIAGWELPPPARAARWSPITSC